MIEGSLSVKKRALLNAVETLSVIESSFFESDTTIAGSLYVYKAFSVNSHSQIGSDLSVIGNATVSCAGLKQAIIDAATIPSIIGGTKFGSWLSIGGSLAVNKSLSVSSHVNADSSLSASYNAVVSGSLSVNSSLIGPTVSTLIISAESLMGNTVSVKKDVLTDRNAIVKGGLSVQDLVTASSNLFCNGGLLSVSSEVFFDDEVALVGSVSINGLFKASSSVSVRDNVTANRAFASFTSCGEGQFGTVSIHSGLLVGRGVSASGIAFIDGLDSLSVNRSCFVNLDVTVGNDSEFLGDLETLGSVNLQGNTKISSVSVSTISVTGSAIVGKYLSIHSKVDIRDAVSIERRFDVGRHVSVGSSLASPLLHGPVQFDSNLSVQADTAIVGKLSLSGSTAISSSLSVSGSVNVRSFVSITGVTAIKSGLSVEGEAWVSALHVEEMTTDISLQSTLSVDGFSEFGSNIYIAGNTGIGGRLSGHGSVCFTNSLALEGTLLCGNMTAFGLVSVLGDALISGIASVASTTYIGGPLDVCGPVCTHSGLSLAGAAFLDGAAYLGRIDTLSVTHNSVLSGYLSVGRPAQFSSINVNDAAIFQSFVSIAAPSAVSADLYISGQLMVANRLSVSGSIQTDSDTLEAPSAFANLGKISVSGPSLALGDFSVGSKAFVRLGISITQSLVAGSDMSILGQVRIGRKLSMSGECILNMLHCTETASISRFSQISSIGHIFGSTSLSIDGPSFVGNCSVKGNSLLGPIRVSDSATFGEHISVGADGIFQGSLSSGRDVIAGGTISQNGGLIVGNALSVRTSVLAGSISGFKALGDISVVLSAFVGSDISVARNAMISKAASLNSLAITGNAIIGSSLSTCGPSSFGSSLCSYGDFSSTGACFVNSSCLIGSGAVVSGQATVMRNLFVAGEISCESVSGLSVVGNSALYGSLLVEQDSTIRGSVLVCQSQYVNGCLSVSSSSWLEAVSISEDSCVDGGISLGNHLRVEGSLEVHSAATLIECSVSDSTHIGGLLHAHSGFFCGADCSVSDNASLGGIISVDSSIVGGDSIFIASDMLIGGSVSTAGCFDLQTGAIKTIGSDILFCASISVSGLVFLEKLTSVTGEIYGNNSLSIADACFVSEGNISGELSAGSLSVNGCAVFDSVVSARHGELSADANIGSHLSVGSSIRASEDIDCKGLFTAYRFSVASTAIFADSVSVQGNVILERNLSVKSVSVFSEQVEAVGVIMSESNIIGKDGIFAGSNITGNQSLSVGASGCFGGPLYSASSIFVDGAVNLEGSLSVGGATELSNHLSVKYIHVECISENVTLFGSLNVTQDIRTSSSLVGLDLVLYGGISAAGTANLGESMRVSGEAQITQDLLVGRRAYVDSTFSASETSVFHGSVSLREDLFVNGESDISGSISVGSMTWIQAACVGSTVSIGGDIFGSEGLSIDHSSVLSAVSVFKDILAGSCSVSGAIVGGQFISSAGVGTFAGSVMVSGHFSAQSSVSGNSDCLIGGSISIHVNSRIGGACSVKTMAYLGDVLSASGTAIASGSISVLSDSVVSGSLSIGSSLNVRSGVSVSSCVYSDYCDIDAVVNVGELLSLNGNAEIRAEVRSEGSITVSRSSHFGEDLFVSDSIHANELEVLGVSHVGSLEVNTDVFTRGALSTLTELFSPRIIVGEGDIESLKETLLINSGAAVGGTLSVDESVMLHGRLSSNQNIFCASISIMGVGVTDGPVSAGERMNIGGVLSVRLECTLGGDFCGIGKVSVFDDMLVEGSTDFSSSFSVSGDGYIQGCLTGNSDVNSGGYVHADGPCKTEDSLSVESVAHLSDSVFVALDCFVNGNLSVGANAEIPIIDDLSVSENILVGGKLSVLLDILGSASVSIRCAVSDLVSADRLISSSSLYLSAQDLCTIEANSTSLAGLTTLGSSLSINGDSKFGKSLSVNDAFVAASAVSVNNDLCLSGTASVSRNILVKENASLFGSLFIDEVLDISGPLFALGILSVGSDAEFKTSVRIEQELHAMKAVFSETLNLSKSLDVGSVAVLRSCLSVEGDVVVDQSVSIKDNVMMSSSLDVEGASSLHSSLSASGPFICSSPVSMSVSARVCSLAVYSATTTRLLSVGDNAYFASSLSVSGLVQVGDQFSIEKFGIFGKSISVSNQAVLTNGVSVTGCCSFENIESLSICDGLVVTGHQSVKEFSVFASGLSVGGMMLLESLFASKTASVKGTLSVDSQYLTGELISFGNLRTESSVQISGALEVCDSTTLNDKVNVNGPVSVLEKLILGGILSTSKNVEIEGSVSVKGCLGSIAATSLSIAQSVVVCGSFSTDKSVVTMLTAHGNATFSNNCDVDRCLTVGGTGVLHSGMSVFGQSVFDGTISVLKNLYLDNAMFVGGSSVVIGDSAFASDVSILSVEIRETASIGGNSLFDSQISSQGNVLIAGILSNVGPAVVHSHLSVAGQADFGSSFKLFSSAFLESSLSVAYNSCVSGGFSIGSSACIGASIEVMDILSVQKKLSVTGSCTVGGDSLVEGLSELFGGISVSKSAAMNSTLSVSSDVIAMGLLSMGGPFMYITGSAQVDGDTHFNAIVSVDSAVFVSGLVSGGSSGALSDSWFVGGNATVQKSACFSEPVFCGALLSVGGPVDLEESLSSKGWFTFSEGGSVSGGTKFENRMTIEGSTVVNATLTVDKSVKFGSRVSIFGSTELGSDARASTLFAAELLEVAGPSCFKSTCEVEGKETRLNSITSIGKGALFGSTLSVRGNTIMNGSGTFSHSVSISGPLISDSLSVANSVILLSDARIEGPLSVGSEVLVSGLLSVQEFAQICSISESVCIGNRLSVFSETFLGNSFSVSEKSLFHSDVSIGSSLNVHGPTSTGDSILIWSSLSVFGQLSVNRSVIGNEIVSIQFEGFFGSLISINDSANVGCDISCDGSIWLGRSVRISNSSLSSESISVAKSLIVSGSLSVSEELFALNFAETSILGSAYIGDDISISGVSYLGGSLIACSDIEGKGSMSMASRAALGGALSVRGPVAFSTHASIPLLTGNSITALNLASSSISVDLSGNFGAISVRRNSHLGSNMCVYGNASFSSSILSSGIKLLQNSLSVSIPLVAQNRLSSSGPTYIGSHLFVDSTSSFAEEVSLSESVLIGSSLFVRGPTETQRLSVTSDTVLLGSLSVFAPTFLCNGVSIDSETSLSGSLNAHGLSYFAGPVLLDSPCTLNGSLSVTDQSSFDSNVSVSLNLIICGTLLSVKGDACMASVECSGGISVFSSAVFESSISVNGDAFFSRNLSTEISSDLTTSCGWLYAQNLEVQSILSVFGNSCVSCSLSVGGTTALVGPSNLFGPLSVDRPAIFAGPLSVMSYTVIGAAVSIQSKGSTVLSGPLSVLNSSCMKSLSVKEGVICSSVSADHSLYSNSVSTSDAVRSSRISVSSQVAMGSALFTTGDSVLSLHSNLELSGTLSVVSNVFTGSDLSIESDLFLGRRISSFGPNIISDLLSVDGLACVSSLSVSQDVSIANGISGRFCQLNGSLSVGRALCVSDLLYVAKTCSISDATDLILGDSSGSGPCCTDRLVAVNTSCAVSGSLSASEVVTGSARITNSVEIGCGSLHSNHGYISSGTCIFSGGSLSVMSSLFACDASTAHNVFIGSALSAASGAFFNGDLSVNGALRLDDFTLYAENTRMITASPNGVGCFHGTWSFEVATTTSDRRLKRDITPLQNALRDRINRTNEPVSDWLLDQLRPVSFKLNEGDGGLRFGFIAQELEKALPEVVRLVEDPSSNGTDSTKSVIYQDLIAILTMVMQEQQNHIKNLEAKIDGFDERIKRLESRRSLSDEEKESIFIVN